MAERDIVGVAALLCSLTFTLNSLLFYIIRASITGILRGALMKNSHCKSGSSIHLLILYDIYDVWKSENHRRIHDSGYNNIWRKKKLLYPLKFCYPATRQALTAQVRGSETTENATETIPEVYQNANSKGLFAIVLTEC